jgi:hypothetical protein
LKKKKIMEKAEEKRSGGTKKRREESGAWDFEMGWASIEFKTQIRFFFSYFKKN